MKRTLLVAACGLLGLNALWAQQAPPPVRQPFEQPALPPAAAAQLAALRPAGPHDRTVRLPGKTTFYAWNSTSNAWNSPLRVELNTYNSQALLTQQLWQDSVIQRPTLRETTTYDASGHRTGTLRELWNGSGWQNDFRYTIANNPAGLLTDFLMERWSAGAWLNVSRLTYRYDAYGHYTLFAQEVWNNGAWQTVAGSRSTQVYSPGGLLLQETEEYQDLPGNTYTPVLRRQYTYAIPNDPRYTSRIDQQWQNGSFVNKQRLGGFRYDGQGRLTYDETEEWVNGAWAPRYRIFTTHLPYGGSQRLYEHRVGTAWETTGRDTDRYDAAGNVLEEISEKPTSNGWTVFGGYRNVLSYTAAKDLRCLVRQNFNQSPGTFENSVKYTYGDYQSITLGSRRAAALAAQTELYPNPTTGQVTLVLNGLPTHAAVPTEVVNSLGQVVQRRELQPRQGQLHEALDLGQFPAGLYTVHLHTSAGLVIKKLVRQ